MMDGSAAKNANALADVIYSIGALDRKAYHDALIKEYGSIKKGEKAVREVELPKKLTDAKNVSKTIQTAMEAQATPTDLLPTLQEMAEDGAFSFESITDDTAMQNRIKIAYQCLLVFSFRTFPLKRSAFCYTIAIYGGISMKNDFCFGGADILLPHNISDKEFAKRFAVIACDQFTSEPAYWEDVEKTVGSAESTLRLILPEAYLAMANENKLSQIAQTMKEYEKNLFDSYTDSLVYVRRTVSGGKIRRGIVGKIDLTAYDYQVGSVSPVRATEGTVLSRIPPRVAVRRAATIESPHIMLLMDDKEKKIIESLDAEISALQKVYDFDLMLNGGHVEGYLVDGSRKARILSAMRALVEKNSSTIQFAVGDGNHSLASAKARFEEIREERGDAAAMLHPLRYALCEVVNLHEDALVFEPIYRIATVRSPKELLSELEAYGAACGSGLQSVHWVFGTEEGDISLGAGTHSLTVGSLQNFLDEYKKRHPETEIDYIHGENSLRALAKRENTVGFLFGGMKKEELFSTVETNGALPRKTFSMGEAVDKRYYIECRKIEE